MIKERKFKIGDKVLFEGIEHTIEAYAGFYSKSYIIKCPCRMYPEKSPNQVKDGFPLKCNKGDYCLLFVNEKELTLIENNMEKGVIKLSLEDAKKLYEQGGNFKTIALGAYSEEELTKPTLPNTWEEFCKNYPVQKEEVFIGKECNLIKAPNYSLRGQLANRNFLPNKETAKAMLALMQLIQLRDCYNQGWKPNWNNDESKYIIRVWKDEIICNEYTANSQVMAFKTEELRDKFYENFRDLLETAKELL